MTSESWSNEKLTEIWLTALEEPIAEEVRTELNRMLPRHAHLRERLIHLAQEQSWLMWHGSAEGAAGGEAASPAIPTFDLGNYIEPVSPIVLSSKSRPGAQRSSKHGGNAFEMVVAAASALWQTVSRPRSMAAIAMTAILLIAATMYFNRPAGPVVAAHLEKALNSRWNIANSDSVMPNEGDALMTGQLIDLAEGDVTLKFVDGATTLVRGPVRIRFTAKNAAQLDRGLLFATVPREAVGFTVETPSARIVDLGTEFTVAVDDKQNTELQVVKGQVETAHRTGDGDFADAVTVAAGEAQRTRRDGITERIAFAPPNQAAEPDVAEAAAKGHPLFPAADDLDNNSPYTVVAHYRMGEDDRPDEVGVTRPAIGKPLLRRAESLLYISDTPGATSKKAISLLGKHRDDLLAADAELPRDLETWSLEAWVRPRNLDDAVLVANGHLKDGGFGFGILGGRLCAWCGNQSLLMPKELLAVDQWTHLALVRDQGRVTLWIDRRASESVSAQPVQDAAGVFAVGGYAGLPFFNGDIDEVRFSRLNKPFDPATSLSGE